MIYNTVARRVSAEFWNVMLRCLSGGWRIREVGRLGSSRLVEYDKPIVGRREVWCLIDNGGEINVELLNHAEIVPIGIPLTRDHCGLSAATMAYRVARTIALAGATQPGDECPPIDWAFDMDNDDEATLLDVHQSRCRTNA